MKINKLYSLFFIIFFASLMTACQEIDRSGRPFRYINSGLDGGDDDSEQELPLPVRPSAVFLQPGACTCQNGKPTSVGKCSNICASKPSSDREMLYLTVKLGEEIELSDMQDLYGWCLTVLTDPTTGEALPGQGNPGCLLEAQDTNDNTFRIDFTPSAGSKEVAIDVSDTLEQGKNYRLTIIEASSGVRSDSTQILTAYKDPNENIRGPLWSSPITQYTCFARVANQDTGNGNMYFDDAYRLHFYFGPGQNPDPIPRSVGNLFCHDIFKYGMVDRENFPRLEETPNVITLWSKEDPRFYDLNGDENTGEPNGQLDIHDMIVREVRNKGHTINNNLNIFHEFRWPGAPELGEDAGNSSAANLPLGYYMVPWINKDNQLAYCPTNDHYNSTNPIFEALGPIIGAPTEGLYIAKKDAVVITNEDGQQGRAPEDYILIRESVLKEIWFYFENGQPIRPTSQTRSKKVQFYWPANPANPYVRQSHQRLYTIKSAAELSIENGETDSSGAPSQSYPPHDKRIGCIPLMQGSSN